VGRLAGPAEPRSLGGGHAGLLGLGHQRNGRSRCASATAMLVAHSRGLVDFDAPVARYWPEFAQNGKEGITLRHLLSHQAGLAALDKPLDLVTASDPDARAEVLAAQRPLWEPGPARATTPGPSAGARARSCAALIPAAVPWAASSPTRWPRP